MATVDVLLAEGDRGEGTRALDELRGLTTGSGGAYEQTDDGMCSYRLQAWLLFLHTAPLPYEEYAALLERGASPAYSKIQNDVHRTLATDPYFSKRVTHSALTRLLNTTAWSTHDKLAAETPLPPSPTLEPQPDALPPIDGDHIVAGNVNAGISVGDTLTVSTPAIGSAVAVSPKASPHLADDGQVKADLYVQGMNVMAAPLLYVSRSEPAAFALLNALLREQVASYFMPGLAGVHYALNLLDEVMALADPELKSYLPPANIYAFGPVMTLCASIPPLSEVLRLWDFLFAAGAHTGVLAVAAILVGMRDELLSTDKASVRLRSLGPLDAQKTIRILKEVVAPKVIADEDLTRRLIRHTHVSFIQG